MGRKGLSPDGWPEFEAPLLREVAAAFLRRRKTLAYHAALSCRKEFAEGSDGVRERLDLVRQGVLGGIVQLSVWADGEVWVSVCVRGRGRNSGWAFADSFNGTALDVSAATLVGMVGATAALRFGPDPPAERERLRLVWARVSPRPG
jgi:hypothetical protein